MSQFKELQERNPETAKKLITMSKDEMIERLSELEIYYDNHEFYKKDLECIVNWGLDYLKDNDEEDSYIHIEIGDAKIVKEVIETKFI